MLLPGTLPGPTRALPGMQPGPVLLLNTKFIPMKDLTLGITHNREKIIEVQLTVKCPWNRLSLEIYELERLSSAKRLNVQFISAQCYKRHKKAYKYLEISRIP